MFRINIHLSLWAKKKNLNWEHHMPSEVVTRRAQNQSARSPSRTKLNLGCTTSYARHLSVFHHKKTEALFQWHVCWTSRVELLNKTRNLLQWHILSFAFRPQMALIHIYMFCSIVIITLLLHFYHNVRHVKIRILGFLTNGKTFAD